MTLFLASVRNPGEAETALAAGADIIDLKDPARGALGALDLETIRACVRHVGGRAPVSATIGDLPMQAEIVRAAVRATAATSVDYVKLGLFPDGDARRCLGMLEQEARAIPLILVLFADALPAFDAIAEAAHIGVRGVMLDTMDKEKGSLPDHLSVDSLAEFVASAKAEGLIMGLAGSLRKNHVSLLLPVQPDLLGFRGALCRGGTREAALDAEACSAIRTLIPRSLKAGLAA